MCDCGFYLSHIYCKHSVAAMVDKKLIEIPELKALEGIFCGNNVGRPENVGGRALERN